MKALRATARVPPTEGDKGIPGDSSERAGLEPAPTANENKDHPLNWGGKHHSNGGFSFERNGSALWKSTLTGVDRNISRMSGNDAFQERKNGGRNDG